MSWCELALKFVECCSYCLEIAWFVEDGPHLDYSYSAR